MAVPQKFNELLLRMFRSYRGPAMIAQERIDLPAVTWPNDAYIAPYAIYDNVRAMEHCANAS